MNRHPQGPARVAAALVTAFAATAFAQDAAVPPEAASAPAAAASAPVAAAAPASAPAAPSLTWQWTALPDERVLFQGMVAPESTAGGAYGMLYPGFGGPIGFLAAIAIHAAVNSGAQAERESAAQTAANAVLAPVKGPLDAFHLAELQRRSLETAVPGSAREVVPPQAAPAAGAWLVQSLPAYMLTPDASAVVLDDTLVVQAPGRAEPVLKQTIRVIGSPEVDRHPMTRWGAANAEALKAESARLLSESIALGLQEAARTAATADHAAPAATDVKTVRYQLGRTERIERAQVLSQQCDRIVMRTLRGALLSVPVAWSVDLPEGCPARPAWPAERVAAPAASAASASAPATATVPASSPAAAASAALLAGN